jgi:hypothetical protein
LNDVFDLIAVFELGGQLELGDFTFLVDMNALLGVEA